MIPKFADPVAKPADKAEVTVDVKPTNNKTKAQPTRKTSQVSLEDGYDKTVISTIPKTKQRCRLLFQVDGLVLETSRHQGSRWWQRMYKVVIMALFLPLFCSLAVLTYKIHETMATPDSLVVEMTLACEPRAIAYGQFEGITMAHESHSMNTVVQVAPTTEVQCFGIGHSNANDTCYVQVIKFHSLKHVDHIHVLEDGTRVTLGSRVCVENYRAYSYVCARSEPPFKKFVYTTVINHMDLQSLTPEAIVAADETL